MIIKLTSIYNRRKRIQPLVFLTPDSNDVSYQYVAQSTEMKVKRLRALRT